MASTPFRPIHVSEDHLEELLNTVRDWQFTHGSLLKVAPRSGRTAAYPVGVSLFPSNFPRHVFESALDIQPIFNKLYTAISNDEGWLYNVLRPQITNDPYSMAAILWKLHTTAKASGLMQPLSLGIFRSDYMLHAPDPTNPTSLKQVEFNTYSVAGGSHSNLISQMHNHLASNAAYAQDLSKILPCLPHNRTIEGIAGALSAADQHYRLLEPAALSAVLFVVQANNVNIADERPIEYALNSRMTRCFRVEFGSEFMFRTSLSDSNALLFHPIHAPETPVEISVVYHRAGYDIEEYDATGRDCRLRIEISNAIKCPTILCHMATLKVVQQRLTERKELQKFLSDEEAEKVLAVCMPMHSLGDAGTRMETLKLVMDDLRMKNYVLKPCLEGGGHNIFGQDIPKHLTRLQQNGTAWDDLVLMEMIKPPEVSNVLMSPSQGAYSGSVVSELGIFGACLWRQAGVQGKIEGTQEGEDDRLHKLDILVNRQVGFSFKTKRRSVKEMSVVKGYGCFDSPFLI